MGEAGPLVRFDDCICGCCIEYCESEDVVEDMLDERGIEVESFVLLLLGLLVPGMFAGEALPDKGAGAAPAQ
jgi:hypothetical protein